MSEKINKKDIGFLYEAEGVKSSIRLIFVLGSFFNMALCTYLAISGTEPGALIATYTAIQTSLGLGKLGQKQIENQNKEQWQF